VWLAFFLCKVLKEFGAMAMQRGDQAFVARCSEQAAALTQAIARSAWDGDWYLRAWFDDGRVLGSASNSECRIDSIAQSWSVLSGVADPQRGRQAMDALEQQLVRPDAALVQLLAPPFDRAEPNPGYIKGYVPGVRENGGQYTHAAVWAGMAYASMGDAQRAWQVYDMLAPINHAASAAAIARYKTEPYVMASDVYACAQHLGRGGWTWYTGSAGWMYRYSVESLLGLRVRGDQLHLAPCVPPEWDGYELRYRYRNTVYAIVVRRTRDVPELLIDGERQPGLVLTLADDGQPHRVELHSAMDAHKPPIAAPAPSTDDERLSHEKK
jgi:cellobiose phosphorylase